MWSLAIVPPNREFTTSRSLTRHEYTNHVFKIRRRVALRGVALDKLFPAFPSYIFLQARHEWDLLRERFPISKFVCSELPPTIVPSLLAVAGGDDVLPTPETPSQRFQPGQRVLIQGMSLLAGYHGTFQNLTNAETAIVLVDWMGRWIPVAVDERDLVEEMRATNGRGKSRRRRRARRAKRRGPVRH